ncbi:MAG TPA: hypothetical protein PKD46_05835 [Aggregatilineaceae bacterium]|jgi:hypothetical protein|nr:hypothetical protein [Aggregatilineaceae bacterium]
MPADRPPRLAPLVLCLFALALGALACATFRAPDDPAPTRPPDALTPSVTPTPTATFTSTPAPSPSPTETPIVTLTPAPSVSPAGTIAAPGPGTPILLPPAPGQ